MAAKFIVLLVLCFFSGIAAQQEECYSTDWFLEFGSCFLQKWLDLLGGIAPNQTTEYRHDTRRTLMSMPLFNPDIHVTGNTLGVASTLERLTSKAKNMQSQYLGEDIMNTVVHQMHNLGDPGSRPGTRKMNSEQKERMKVVEKLGKVDTTKVVNGMGEKVVSVAQQLQHMMEMMPDQEQLDNIIKQASEQKPNFRSTFYNTTKNDITDVFPKLAGLLPLLPVGCIFCPGDNCFVPFPDILCSDGGLVLLEELGEVMQCLVDNNFSETDFEDGIDWMKCIYRCDDIAPIGECVQAVSSTCENTGVGYFFLEVVAEYIFKLGDCRLAVPTTSFDLEEGDDPTTFEVKSYMPHTLYCLDFSAANSLLGIAGLLVDWIGGGFGQCPVQIQVSTHNYLYNVLSMDISLPVSLTFPPIDTTVNITSGWPRCLTGPLVNQVLIGRHEFDGDCACSVELNENSWNETHVFPLVAAIDNKVDGDVVSQLTVKLRVKGFTVQSQKVEVNIIDRDLPDPICSVLGVPLVTTFDGYQYNNTEEGYFTMYRHLTLPYEVQVRKQNCSSSSGLYCICAVAIRTGDDVFVLDRCLEGGETEVPPTRTIMYLNGELNPGTRLFVQEEGSKYQVALPIGTIITMTTGSENSISMWIQGSAKDRGVTGFRGFNRAIGLCGTYNGDNSDEEVKPDDTDAADTADFINSWSVAEADRLFSGAVQDDSLRTEPEMCRCSYMIMFGVQCRCGHDQYVHLCDFNRDGEMSDTIQMIGVQSENQRSVEKKQPNWTRRTGANKASSQPKKSFTSFDDTAARRECEAAILNNTVVTGCISALTGFSQATVQGEIDACAQGVVLSQTTVFVSAAVEGAKQRCKVMMSQIWGMRHSLSYRDILRDDCLYSCSGHGSCNNSTCECDAGFTGADCSRWSNATMTISQPDITACDTRGGNCLYATIIGSEFNTEQHNLTYYVQQNELTSSGSIQSHGGTRQEAEALVISQNQLAATLPDGCLLDQALCDGSQAFGAVYQIELEGVDFKPQVLVYDSACYDCTVTGTSASCALKSTTDYCVISSRCYDPTENNAGDECSVCDPSMSMSDWSVNMSSQACIDAYNERIDTQNAEDREDQIRIIVACILSGTVVLVAIILFFTVGRIKKVKKDGGVNGHVITKDPEEVDRAKEFITDNGVTLVKPDSNGKVNSGYNYGNEPDEVFEKL